ncbi:hypothetical protein [Prosthecomicrobium sp. N25]|uniref:hypothetical protein n=1 Tax=Prosthecomicrobium sp. N25 TaxID=3129254 RepID=UPI003076E31A
MLLDAIGREPSIVRAVVYGSRQTGVRREKPKPERLDIDLAIEVRPKYADRAFTEFSLVAARLKDAKGLRIQAEDLSNTDSVYYPERQRGVLIFERCAS